MEALIVLQAYAPYGLTILRISLGTIFLVHGWQKFAMWNMKPSEQMPSSMLSMMKTLSIVETIAGFALIFGVFAQIAAVITCIIMIGAIYFKTQKWGKKFTGDGGWEFDVILLAASITVLLTGPGAIALLP
ncbi:DoxX family protein [Candidatus Uhrbacteria bacterium]|nr:DoxX family protein [Candidatus Uhrbacteria bacterium]